MRLKTPEPYEPASSDERPSKKLTAIMVIVIILFFVALGLLFWQRRSQDTLIDPTNKSMDIVR